MVEWETEDVTEEPLSIIAADDPVTCAAYAKKHNLLNLPGLRRFKNIAKSQELLNQSHQPNQNQTGQEICHIPSWLLNSKRLQTCLGIGQVKWQQKMA